jgi:Leucine-rich repeat (LRR) protein
LIAYQQIYVAFDPFDQNAARALSWLAADVGDNSLSNLEDQDYDILQRYALATFYYATNDKEPDSWFNAGGWMTKSPVCDWMGILCNEQQQVQGISLIFNNLRGSIPIEMAFLADSLTTIDLGSNMIYMEGGMFKVFEYLSSLEFLSLDDNLLTTDKGLPKAFLELQSLEKLRLSYNLLQGPLDGNSVLEGLRALTHLEIGSNFLTGSMPPSVSELSNLEYFFITRNQMTFDLEFLSGGQLQKLGKYSIFK